MKVLLLAPYRPHINFGTKRQDILPSEALLILYAVLREAGHQPIMRNFTTNVVEEKPDPVQFSYDTVLKIIKEERPALVGITCLFGGDFPYASALAKFIKKNAPEIKQEFCGVISVPETLLISIKNENNYYAI